MQKLTSSLAIFKINRGKQTKPNRQTPAVDTGAFSPKEILPGQVIKHNLITPTVIITTPYLWAGVKKHVLQFSVVIILLKSNIILNGSWSAYFLVQ